MSNFHVESKRVPKIDDPLLIIGLGGTGTDALLNIMSKFKDRFILPEVNDEKLDHPARTAYMAVDTDEGHLDTAGIGSVRFQSSDKCKLFIPAMDDLINNPANMKAWEKSWWDTKIPAFKAGEGAGGFRQAGRLMLFRNTAKVIEELRNKIFGILAVEKHKEAGSLTVVITTGIGGGTGSGTFLDMAYLIRYVINKHFNGVDVKIMAYVIMPGVNLAAMNNPKESKVKCLKMNAFAALKELDFWMNLDKHKYVHEQKYSEEVSHKWNTPPFNQVVLLSEGKEDGTNIINAYSVVMDVLSESLLNFFAQEESTGMDGTFSYRSHAVNVAVEEQQMTKAFPVNYTYMSVGAANSEAQQDNMVVYEAKLTFDAVLQLENADKILGTPEADVFLEKVLPKDEDLLRKFEAECPLPAFFDGEPGYEPASVFMMQGDDALHGEPLRNFVYSTNMHAQKYAKERAEEIYKRFNQTITDYITNPLQGPFRILEMLNDDKDGFVKRFRKFTDFWEQQKNNADNEAMHATARAASLYSEMAKINRVMQMAGMYGKVKDYIDGSYNLYSSKRDALFSKYMYEEFKAIDEKIRDYSKVILPTFCRLLKEVHSDLVKEVNELIRTSENVGSDMIDFNGLKNYIDKQVAALSQAGRMNATTIKILEKLVAASLSVSLDIGDGIEDWENLSSEFLAVADSFVNDMGSEINGVSMDQILSMTMPQATENEKITYITDTLMKNLRSAAKTMLKLKPGDDGKVEYSYVSVPDNAEIVRKGLVEYANRVHITPKFSSINDRIFWLNTYNCLPMYRYADLPDLERVYEDALKDDNAMGIHLVRTRAETPRLDSDWSVLPSPLPHALLGLETSKRLTMQNSQISNLLDAAINAKFAELTTDGTTEVLTIRIIKNNDGSLMEPETLLEKANIILQDAKITDEERIIALEALRDDCDLKRITYRDYSEVFANAMGLILKPKDGTASERERVREATHLARMKAAKYILATQHPDIVELMKRQQEMYEKLDALILPIGGHIELEKQILDFSKEFMHLYLFDSIIWNRQSIDYINVSGQQVKLMGANMLTPTEINVYKHCKPLVLLRVLATDDDRINSIDRKFLTDKAKRLIDEVDRMSDEDYQRMQENAKQFISSYQNTPNEIMYDKSDISKVVRERNSKLLDQMLGEAKIFRI